MTIMTSQELIDKYLVFFAEKGHAVIDGAPLVPENDPSVLFTTAGMHPLVPYLKGQEHPAGKRLVNVQRCLRTTDIDEVGDDTHATVFEMLGNWSLGDYFKEEAIAFSWEFLTGDKWLGLDPEYLAVSVFGGDRETSKDKQAFEIWKGIGVPEERVALLDKTENWWPAHGKGSGGNPTGPQGPDTEMFYWTGEGRPPQVFDADDKGWVEIWNDVFMEFDGDEEGNLAALRQKNVDTGMGVERTVAVLNGKKSIYEIGVYPSLLELIREQANQYDEHQGRIIADHVKASAWLMLDKHGVVPANSEQGYVLRRVIRRAVRAGRLIGINDIKSLLILGVDEIVKDYGGRYPSFKEKQEGAKLIMKDEVERFEKALGEGLKKFARVAETVGGDQLLSGLEAFRLYESFGFPIELTQELAQERGLKINMDEYRAAAERHQEASREGAKAKFKGGLADKSEKSVKYHTATHLLHRALKDVLGAETNQKGSNITAERLRFDFNFGEKMTAEQIREVEDIVNSKIAANLAVTRKVMTLAEAKKSGATGLFEAKYGDEVSVYEVGDYSKELCGGPHVERTGVLGRFKITKEESAGAGIRRIKAVLEDGIG